MSFLYVLIGLSFIQNGQIVDDRSYRNLNDSICSIEKAYLHIDRDTYSPGDNIWFKAYLIDAQDNILTDNSHLLYVELISPDKKILMSRKVELKNGLGKGDFSLQKNITSGIYKIRAYTNYMRNFNSIFFNKDVLIISSLQSFSEENTIKSFDIDFFPEGGALVDDVTSVVAFKAADQAGNGCNVRGNVYSASGDSITSFKSSHEGMGFFHLKSSKNRSYYAIVFRSTGDTIRRNLPRSFPTGIVMNINRINSESIEARFNINAESCPYILNRDFQLSFSNRYIELKRVSFRMKSMNNYLVVSTFDLPDGIVSIRLESDGNPLCERLIYIHPSSDMIFNISTDKNTYSLRDSVSLKVQYKELNKKNGKAFFSVAVAESNSLNNTVPYPSGIASSFLLESEIVGTIENPSQYFDVSNPDRFKDLDLLLLTQGWRDFKWKYNDLSFLPEKGFKVSGQVKRKFNDSPINNTSVSIGLFSDHKPLIYDVTTDSSGMFYLGGIELTGKARIIASVSDKKYKLFLDSMEYSPAAIEFPLRNNYFLRHGSEVSDFEPAFSSQTRHETLIKYIEYSLIKDSIQKKYKLSDTVKLAEVEIISHRIQESVEDRTFRYLGNTDGTTLVTPAMQKYGTVGSLFKSGFRIFHIPGYVSNPIYLINGTKVPGEVFYNVAVSQVARFDILGNRASMAAWGTNMGDSITSDYAISLTTWDIGTYTGELPDYTAVVEFAGYDEPRIFYSPKHSKQQVSYDPDLRTTLLWKPDNEIENNNELLINYYNADNPTGIDIIIEGITSTGIPFTRKAQYRLVKQ